MTNIKIPIHIRNVDARKESLVNWKISAEDKKDLLTFVNDLALGKVNKGRRVGEARQLKYLDMLKIPLESFKKPVSTLHLKDIEAFEMGLTSNRIQSCAGAPYAASTKSDIRRALKIYLKWKYGETDHYRELCGWLDTRTPETTPDYLSEREVDLLYKACQTSAQRFFIAVLFDSGARAEEFHNIRYEDIKLPNDSDNYVKITIKDEYSKTKGRTISLYWKHSLEAARDFMAKREGEYIKMDEPVFQSSYDAMRQWLNRIGTKILYKSLGYHLFRHSSATYYASQLNRQQLCYRYGWKFSSNMPDVYISRAGMENKELDEKFAGTKIEKLEHELLKKQKETEMIKDWEIAVKPQLDQKFIMDEILNELVKDPEKLRLIAQAIINLGLKDKLVGNSLSPSL